MSESKFCFVAAIILSIITSGLYLTNNYWTLISFSVGTASFAFLSLTKLIIERAIKAGLPK